jgi:methionine-rich copper-binding protein CopC
VNGTRASRRRTAGASAVLVLLAALWVALAPTASAHDELVSSSPGSGDTVAAPDALTLTYSESLIDTGYRVVVSGPDGAVPGDVRVSGERVVERFRQPLAAGAYDVLWRVVSSDGHPISGKLSFTVRAARTASPTSTAAASPTSSSPASSSATAPTTSASPTPSGSPTPPSETGGLGAGGVLAVVAAALVAAATALALARRNRGAPRA